MTKWQADMIAGGLRPGEAREMERRAQRGEPIGPANGGATVDAEEPARPALCWTHFKEACGFSIDSTRDDWIAMLDADGFSGPEYPRSFAPCRRCIRCNPEGQVQRALAL